VRPEVLLAELVRLDPAVANLSSLEDEVIIPLRFVNAPDVGDEGSSEE
jgi:hypothetical protein